MMTNGALKVLTCLFFAMSCGLLLWKMTPTGTASETSTGTEGETPTGYDLHFGDAIFGAVLYSNDFGCTSITATEEMYNWTKTYMAKDFQDDDYEIDESVENFGARQLYPHCDWMNDYICAQIPGICATLCPQEWGRVRELNSRSQFDPAVFEGKSLEELAAMAPVVVNLGHGYDNDETGISFPRFESSDPNCDETTVKLMVF